MTVPQIVIVGVDLAWGERNPDGVCTIDVAKNRPTVRNTALLRGDDALLEYIDAATGNSACFIAIDAPLVCPNATGSRPVDRLTHVNFGRYKCGCYPANLEKCPRPPRIARKLQERGIAIGWDMRSPGKPRLAAEVYPHPALVRWLGLSERIPYKKGLTADRRLHFAVLQSALGDVCRRHFPRLRHPATLEELLHATWTKPVEDRIDAYICALIGLWHYLKGGRETQVLGDCDTGFLLVPDPRPATQKAAASLPHPQLRSSRKTAADS